METAGGTSDLVASEFARLVRAELGQRVREVILFGSRARGEARPDSDYDDVVVVDRRSREVREAILAIEVDLMDRYGSLISCLLRDERQWEASQKQPIGMNVAREGVPL